jgi:hypothetical protein
MQYSTTKYSHCAVHWISRTSSLCWALWPTSHHLPHPPSLWQPPFYFLLLWVWLFWILQISEIMHYLSFCIWLMSLSIMSSRFVCVATSGRISFSLKAEFYSILYINGYLGRFHVLAIMNNASVNIECRCLFKTFPLGIHPEVRLLDIIVLFFLGTALLFSVMALPIYILTFSSTMYK